MKVSKIVVAALSAFTCAKGQEREQTALLGDADGREDIKLLNVAIIGWICSMNDQQNAY